MGPWGTQALRTCLCQSKGPQGHGGGGQHQGVALEVKRGGYATKLD